MKKSFSKVFTLFAPKAETPPAPAGPRPSLRQRIKLAQRTRRRLFILAAFILVPLLVFWRPIQQQCLVHLLLRSDSPSSEGLSDAVQQTGDPKSLLIRLWQTQRIPHRQFVLSYLGKIVNSDPNLFREMEPLVINATSDVDITVRESAFAALTRMKHPQLRQLAREQLDDADPAARVLGLLSLRSIAVSNDVPIAMGLLNDPDPRVVVSAGLVLRQATGNDFGIKSSLAQPRFTSIDNTNRGSAPDLKAINRGVQRWRDWWQEHRSEYATPGLTHELRRSAPLTMRDFSLEDTEGKMVHFSDHHGKPVLLAFCTLNSPVSLDDVPALNALRRREADSLEVLAICIPPAQSCADEHDHGSGPQGSEHEHLHHGEASSLNLNTPEGRFAVQNAARQRQIDYPMLLDATGEIGRRFSVEDLPTYALVDGQGMIRRRFIGNRGESVFAAMVAELANTNSVHSEATPEFQVQSKKRRALSKEQ